MKNITKTIITLSTLLFVSCGDNEVNNEISILESKIEREANITVDISSLKTFANNNNKFAFSLLKKLHETEKDNIYFSPYSISKSLATIYMGADDESREEIATIANFDTSNSSHFHKTFNALDLEINHVDSNYTFNVTNAMWLQKGTSVLDSYLNDIKFNYGDKVRTVDYANKAKESRNAINTWVDTQNGHRIENIISENKINKNTQLIITNTAIFENVWSLMFLKENTKTETFSTLNGSTIQIPFMTHGIGCSNHLYYRGSNYKILNLPLWGLYKEKIEGLDRYFSRSNMIIVLPDKGEFNAVIQNIELIYQNKKENMSRKNTIIKIPKFNLLTSSYDMKQYLKNMGIKRIFENNESLNRITDSSLEIDNMLHKASIEVYEEGINKSPPPHSSEIFSCEGYSEHMPFYANRPFIFFIENKKTDQVLFMGVIKEPSKN